MARDRSKRKITIEIDNLTEAQEIAIKDLLSTWQSLGGVGSSRWTAFYADGDGDFRPKILVNGVRPTATDLVSRDDCWKADQTVASYFARGDAYKIDFDWIGWALQAKEDAANGNNSGKESGPSL